MKGRKAALPQALYEHNFSQLAKREPYARTRQRFLGLSHLREGATITGVAIIISAFLPRSGISLCSPQPGARKRSDRDGAGVVRVHAEPMCHGVALLHHSIMRCRSATRAGWLYNHPHLHRLGRYTLSRLGVGYAEKCRSATQN